MPGRSFEDDMIARMIRLERRCGLWRWATFGALSLTVLSTTALVGLILNLRSEFRQAQAAARPTLTLPQTRVVSKSFALMGRDGSPRAVLALDDKGDPALEFRDRAQKTRLRIGVDGDGIAGLEFRGSRDQNLAQLSAGPDDSSMLMLQDDEKKPRCLLGTNANGNVGFWLFDREGLERSRWFYQADNGATSLAVRDGDGKTRIEFVTAPGNEASINLYDKNEKIRFDASVDRDDESHFGAKNKAGTDHFTQPKP